MGIGVNYKEYRKMVIDLASKERPIKDEYLKNGLTNNIIHALMGIESEYIEYISATINDDNENMIEEIGDFTWFLTLLISELGGEVEKRFEELFNNFSIDRESSVSEEKIMEVVDDIIGVTKAILFYKKGVDVVKLTEVIIDMWINIVAKTCIITKSNFERIIEHNVRKLKKRYSKGVFSNEDAINRADKRS